MRPLTDRPGPAATAALPTAAIRPNHAQIAVAGLSYTYPGADQPALRDISLSIRPGEFVIVAGPSGAGKSTWLRTLNGLVPHFSGGTLAGTVVVDGQDAVRLGPDVLSRHVGFVFQNPEAQAVLGRVEAEIAFNLENAGIDPQAMRVRVEEVLDLLDLAALRDRQLTDLSGGERQRVALACALALRPRILVLDEPTSQLDPKSAESLLHTLVRLNEELGLTVILAEHRLERVLRYADRVLYFEDGRLTIDDDVRAALPRMPMRPPLVDLAATLGWRPLPLTTKEGRRFARQLPRRALQPRDRRVVGPPRLEVRNLAHQFADRPTLHGINLALHAGEVVVLMGRNGAGKTTLLRCIMGLLKPRAGAVAVDGAPAAGRSVASMARSVAYLPQNPDDLLFAETVRDELAVTLGNHGVGDSAESARLLDQLGLAALADAYPRDLSVGQRQRVAMAAVLVTGPPVIMLDEPTRGLDYATKKQFADLIRRWRDAGKSVLLVTHDVELAAQIADRIVVVADGAVIADGHPADVLPESPLFAPQIARLFPGTGWLTVADALHGLGHA